MKERLQIDVDRDTRVTVREDHVYVATSYPMTAKQVWEAIEARVMHLRARLADLRKVQRAFVKGPVKIDYPFRDSHD